MRRWWSRCESKYAAVAAERAVRRRRPGVRAVAEAFGYTPEELAAVPAEANMGLSCGNPTATAHLQARRGGRRSGLRRRHRRAAGLAQGRPDRQGHRHRHDAGDDRAGQRQRRPVRPGACRPTSSSTSAASSQLPLPDASVDCLICNCVINLAPGQAGRLPRDVPRAQARRARRRQRHRPEAAAAAGSWPETSRPTSAASPGRSRSPTTSGMLREAGFAAVQVVDTRKDLNAYAQVESQSGCCGSSRGLCCPARRSADLHDELADLLARYDVNDYAASVQVYAVKA